jgi:oligopeptide transport system permease protein
MGRLIASRLLQLPIILTVIFLVTFSLLLLSPGNPFDRNPERPLDPEIIKRLTEKYKFNDPIGFVAKYVTNVATKFDFGDSLQYRDRSVRDIILQGLPVSAALGVLALVVALVLGLTAGIVGALRPGSPWDMGSLVIALIGVSLPSFVTASILLTVFAGLLFWFPASGWGTPMHAVLPAIALGAAPAAYIARLTRLGLADVMSSDFVRTARAKGLSIKSALFNHALKVAFLPVLSFLGPAAAGTMTGSFVIENVFAIPGLGKDFVNSVLNNDRFVTLGLVLIYSTILIVFNLIVDVAYAWVDPRIEV